MTSKNDLLSALNKIASKELHKKRSKSAVVTKRNLSKSEAEFWKYKKAGKIKQQSNGKWTVKYFR